MLRAVLIDRFAPGSSSAAVSEAPSVHQIKVYWWCLKATSGPPDPGPLILVCWNELWGEEILVVCLWSGSFILLSFITNDMNLWTASFFHQCQETEGNFKKENVFLSAVTQTWSSLSEYSTSFYFTMIQCDDVMCTDLSLYWWVKGFLSAVSKLWTDIGREQQQQQKNLNSSHSLSM